VVDADFRLPSLDYSEVLKVTQALTRHAKDVEQIFWVMVFNVLAKSPTPKTLCFSFLMDEYGEWRLAPAYDLTYSQGINGEHTTSIVGEGRAPTKAHMFKVGEAVGLKPSTMAAMIENVSTAINRWNDWCDMAGIAKGKRDVIV